MLRPQHYYVLKLNADKAPATGRTSEWVGKEYSITPVKRFRAQSKISPPPPSQLLPGANIAVWINDNGKEPGGFAAQAVVDKVSHSGTRCRLRDVFPRERLGFDHLAEIKSAEMQDLYRDLNADRRSKLRTISSEQWDALDWHIGNFRRHEVLGSHVTFVGHMALVLNKEAKNFRIGDLQNIRSRIRGKRVAGSDIFSTKSVKKTYAFHSGGREELQFNIGTETLADGRERFRWGVAFSFEPSRSFPNPEILARNVRFFNDYISLYGDDFADMTMWKNADREGVTDMGPPQPIDPSLVRNNVFIFLGKYDSSGGIDPTEVLRDFDRLLPLYEYVESGATIVPERPEAPPFVFKPGHKKKARKAVASKVARELEMDLRHEAIQAALHTLLAEKYGAKLAGTEQICPCGTRVDAMVKHDTGYWLYEIKTSSSPRVCLREALGQLLEYCLWPGGVPAERLIVVGETPLDADAKIQIADLVKKRA